MPCETCYAKGTTLTSIDVESCQSDVGHVSARTAVLCKPKCGVLLSLSMQLYGLRGLDISVVLSPSTGLGCRCSMSSLSHSQRRST